MSDEVLVRVENVSKKFCRSLKKSLWYGVRDIVSDLNPFGCQNSDGRSQKTDLTSDLRPLASEASLRRDEFWAVNNVSFELRRGECLGLIGRNGAGKTTLLKMLNGLIKPDHGRIEMRGRVGALIALGAGFNPILTGRENIYVNGSVLGLSKGEIDERFEDIVNFAEVPEFIDAPVQSYSSGMLVRLGFAVATSLQPDILLLDEVLAVGDQAFRTKCFKRIGNLIEKCCVIFVSHDEAQIARICDRSLLLNQGSITAAGETGECLAIYRELGKPCGELAVTTHEAISDFHCATDSPQLNWGGGVKVTVAYTLNQPLTFGEVIFSLRQYGTSLVQGVFPAGTFSGDVGKHTYKLEMGPVHMRSGKYSVALYAISPTKKITLIHGLELCEVRILGPNGYGPVYQAPISCKVKNSVTEHTTVKV